MKQVYAPEDNTRAESLEEIDAAREELEARIIDDLKTFGRCDIEVGNLLPENHVKLDMVDVFQHVLDNLPADSVDRNHINFILMTLCDRHESLQPLTDAAIEYLAEHSKRIIMKCISAQDFGVSIQVNLCDSCCHEQPICTPSNIIFGDGIGNDNVAACSAYEPVYLRPHRDDSKSAKELGLTGE